MESKLENYLTQNIHKFFFQEDFNDNKEIQIFQKKIDTLKDEIFQSYLDYVTAFIFSCQKCKEDNSKTIQVIIEVTDSTCFEFVKNKFNVVMREFFFEFPQTKEKTQVVEHQQQSISKLQKEVQEPSSDQKQDEIKQQGLPEQNKSDSQDQEQKSEGEEKEEKVERHEKQQDEEEKNAEGQAGEVQPGVAQAGEEQDEEQQNQQDPQQQQDEEQQNQQDPQQQQNYQYLITIAWAKVRIPYENQKYWQNFLLNFLNNQQNLSLVQPITNRNIADEAYLFWGSIQQYEAISTLPQNQFEQQLAQILNNCEYYSRQKYIRNLEVVQI